MITRISKSPPAQAKCRWRQIFGAGGAIIQKKNKEKEKGKGKEERREKRKKERERYQQSAHQSWQQSELILEITIAVRSPFFQG
jgi:hypothetical protein